MKALASEGRTVFVSSHLMSEMENTADHSSSSAAATHPGSRPQSSSRPTRSSPCGSDPQPDELTLLATAAGATVRDAGGTLVLLGLNAAQVGELAFENGIRLHELAPGMRRLSRRSWS